MPRPFVPLTLVQFRELLARFTFTRSVATVHMHHTFHPNRAEFKGLSSIEGMFDFHTQTRGFSDIAQHVTIAPDGTIWTGRNWNQPPASATGHNGNPHFGPFMFEMIGDFDSGRETFDDPQRETALEVIAAVQQRFGLPPEALRFHRDMSTKTCPGSSIDFAEIVAAVRARHGARDAGRSADEEGPFPESFRDRGLAGSDGRTIDIALDSLSREMGGVDPESAELSESPDDVLFTGRGTLTSRAARGVEITPADLIALRPHVINLNEGQLTEGGEYFTLPADVQRIFGEDMERAFADPESAGMPPRAGNEPFRVMIWAHGGLISEKNGLAIALKHLEFWKRNGIYPVYFVWETGLLGTIGQLLRGAGGGTRAARNFFSDKISDPILEAAARVAGGEKIWSGMKRNAELASLPSGGATTAARELKGFCDRHADAVELHAAGHSAGAIFHAHFLPVALAGGIPDVTGLYLLAPAIRVDAFKERLLSAIGERVKHLGMFTMFKEQELDDHCAHIYRKSLLYLIRVSFERERKAEVLGLEESLRRDHQVERLFGLGGQPSGNADVVFSPSPAADGQHASQSTSHGGFDDDAPTMNSIALRVLRQQSSIQLAKPYPVEAGRAMAADPWTPSELVDLQRSFAEAFGGVSGAATVMPALAAPAPVAALNRPVGAATGDGRKRALCVGIDRYPLRPLAGCVADARRWADLLKGFGFQIDMLLDGDATYVNVKARLQQLVEQASAGDVLVWQYAGHGTQVPDINGDERTGDSPGMDEAICPVDLQTGQLFTDDEIAELIHRLPSGVSFTLIMDCCHSGTLNRFGIGEPSAGAAGADQRPRFLPLTDELAQAYLQFARSRQGTRALSRSRTRDALDEANEVLFTACLSTEVAWESNGQGEFTLRATTLLGQRGAELTNEQFAEQVVAAFGPNRRQTPTIACAQRLRSRRLFQAFDEHTPLRGDTGAAAGAQPDRFDRLASALENVARELRST